MDRPRPPELRGRDQISLSMRFAPDEAEGGRKAASCRRVEDDLETGADRDEAVGGARPRAPRDHADREPLRRVRDRALSGAW